MKTGKTIGNMRWLPRLLALLMAAWPSGSGAAGGKPALDETAALTFARQLATGRKVEARITGGELFLETNKLWDFLEKVDHPRPTTRRVMEQLLKRLDAAVARPAKAN
ncbi:MAG: hypothetical protein NTW21_09455 [Verrucomicrobia bacterium]|nr:hypothetical protein [Verrucomicrobiota bacterium]